MTEIKDKLPLIENVDLVLSLGNACRPAYRINEAGFRDFASPLDWMMCYDLNAAYTLFENHFENFFSDFEDLGDFDKRHKRVLDKATNMESIHHFNTNQAVNLQLAEFQNVMKRRFERIFERVKKARKIVFVNLSDESIEAANEFLNKICKLWGDDKEYIFIKITNDENLTYNTLKITQFACERANLKVLHYEANDTSLSQNKADFWIGNSFAWGEVFKNIKLSGGSYERNLSFKIAKFVMRANQNGGGALALLSPAS